MRMQGIDSTCRRLGSIFRPSLIPSDLLPHNIR